MALTRDQVMEALAAGETLPMIGQVDALVRRELDRLARKGEIGKWRGYWYPAPGAPFGIGPLKTCYGPIEAQDYWANHPQFGR